MLFKDPAGAPTPPQDEPDTRDQSEAEDGPEFSDEPPTGEAFHHLPPVPDPKAVQMDKCLKLVVAIGRAHPNPAEGAKWNPTMGAILWQLMGETHDKTPDGSAIRLTHNAIATALNLTIKVVRDRLHALAQFGLIRCVNTLDTKRKFFQVGSFSFNPLMAQLVVKRGRKISRGAIDPFLAMGLARDQNMGHPQGWEGYDCEYGDPEPSAGTPDAYGRQLAPWARAMGNELETLEEAAVLAGAAVASKGLRAQERLKRTAAAESFVAGCATVWQQAHAKRGFGTGRPAWEGPYESLSPENKKQFRELKALFERYGGQTTGMAWACFVNYNAHIDEKGRPKFDPALPHVQWVSTDKKPQHFAKHFDAVLMDPVVVKLFKDEGAVGRIREVIGKHFDAPPAPPLAVAAQKGAGGK